MMERGRDPRLSWMNLTTGHVEGLLPITASHKTSSTQLTLSP
jgi:hypothetical protein